MIINFKSSKINNQGFTLIELILALAIIGILISMATGAILQAFNIVTPSTKRMNAKQMAEIRLAEIISYARNAKDINKNNDTITTIENTLKFENNKIIIEDISSGNEIRSFSQINSFNITDDNNDGVYKIEIQKCYDEDCNNTVTISKEVSPRNSD
jgi:prepilin-type N-terminal cleavage/methylation domain-containing protein